MRSVVVFCGSSMGNDRAYYDHAYTLGRVLASNGISVVFGGGKVGLMGALAEGAMHHDGQVIGIIPTFLKTKEIANEDVSQMIEVENMHERKMRMHTMSDAIIAMPGGWGTMEELFEMMTWAQIGLHSKPIGILNVNGFYDPFLQLLNKMVQDGFVKEEFMQMVIVGTKVEMLIADMQNYTPPSVTRIADTSKT